MLNVKYKSFKKGNNSISFNAISSLSKSEWNKSLKYLSIGKHLIT